MPQESKEDVIVTIAIKERAQAEVNIVFSAQPQFLAEQPALNNVPIQQRSLLYYLNGFDEKELKELEAHYGKSRAELEKLVANYPIIYWSARINYFIANYGSCALFLLFPIQTGNQGIITVAQLFKADAQVPNGVGYGIGVPLSLIDVVFFMFLFSARKEAVKSTLWYANKKPFSVELAETKAFAKEHPWLALRDTAVLAVDESILRTYNLNGAVTELIYLPAVITGLNFSTGGMTVAILITLYFGNEYFRKYTDNDYREGKQFWLNKEKRPWLITKLVKERNFSTPIQVWLIAASTIAARTFLYYGIAVTAQQVIGDAWLFGWFSPWWVASSAFVHGVFVRYPSIFNHHSNADEKTITLLSTHHSFDEVLVIKKQYQQDLLEKEGYFFLLKKDPIAIVLPGFGLILGGYLGYGLASEWLSQVMNKVVAEALFIPTGALFLGKLFYNAERDRVVHNQHELELQRAPVELQTPIVQSADKPSKGIISAAIILNLSAAIIAVTSTIGESENAIGSNNTSLNAVITLLSILMGLGSLLLNQDKLVPTVKDFYDSLPSRRSICPSFFKPALVSQQVVDAGSYSMANP